MPVRVVPVVVGFLSPSTPRAVLRCVPPLLKPPASLMAEGTSRARTHARPRARARARGGVCGGGRPVMRACPVGCPGGRACTRAGSQGGKLLFSTEGGRSGRARQAGRQALCAPAWTAAPIRAVRARGGRAGVPRRRPRGASRSAGAWGTRWPLAHGRLCWFRLLVATGSRLVVGRIGDGLAGKGVHRTTTDGECAARSPAVRGPARGGRIRWRAPVAWVLAGSDDVRTVWGWWSRQGGRAPRSVALERRRGRRTPGEVAGGFYPGDKGTPASCCWRKGAAGVLLYASSQLLLQLLFFYLDALERDDQDYYCAFSLN